MYSSKMLGCVSLENFGVEHSENQIGGGDTIKWGTLQIFDILPLGGHYFIRGDIIQQHGVHRCL